MQREEPGLRFRVTIDGYGSLGNWTRCDGLSIEYDVEEYREGGVNDFVHHIPGRARYGKVTLTRYLDSQSGTVAAWLSSVQTSLKRQTAQIAVLDPAGETVTQWNLTGAFPVKWTGPRLEAGSNDVAIEQLELVHNGFEVG